MRSSFLKSALAACLLGPAFVSMTAAAEDVQQIIDDRIAGFRDMGSAFKNIADELKARQPNVAKIRLSAGVIDNYSMAIPNWFPPGTQPPPKQSGGWLDRVCKWFGCADDAGHNPDENHAKPEIWAQPAMFQQAYQRFDVAADGMLQAAKAGDIGAISTQLRKLEASCKGCHDSFREEVD